MPPLPPAQHVLDTLQHLALPAAGGAALVMCLFAVTGRWAGALGSAAAVVAAFVWANYNFPSLVDQPGQPRPDLWGTGRIIPWTPEKPDPGWVWLPRAALVLVVVGLVSRWLGLAAARYLPERRWWGANLLVWAPRLAAVAAASGWLVPAWASAESPWLRAALAAAMLTSWAALDGVARSRPAIPEPDDIYAEPPTWSGAGGQVAAYQAAIFLAAGAVLIHAHSNRFMDAALILACAMFGVAVAAGAAKTDASGAVPAGVGFLPGLMLNGRLQTESQVPLVCFWLVALAPLALTPFLIPRLNRQNGWLARVARAVLVLIPLVIAVVLAAKHENLAFEEEW